MSVKLFILGRPGSGKSTAARCIAVWARDYKCPVTHINDYEILQAMFWADTEHKQFRPTERGGFDAIDLTVLDIALKEVENRVQMYVSAQDMRIVTIEFARNDYDEAFKQFTPAFLQDAYFLYIDADLDTCLQRVHERLAHPSTIDDHPSFSDELFKSHYAKDNKPYMEYQLQSDFNVEKLITVIENMGSLQEFVQEIGQFAREIFERENCVYVHVGIPRE